MRRNKEIIPNDAVLRYYFYFMQERMDIFWRKCEGKKILTKDPILREYKFTNVYRACDRVSQYLISSVIYKDITESVKTSLNLKDYSYSTIGCYYFGQYLGYIGWSDENKQYMFYFLFEVCHNLPYLAQHQTPYNQVQRLKSF